MLKVCSPQDAAGAAIVVSLTQPLRHHIKSLSRAGDASTISPQWWQPAIWCHSNTGFSGRVKKKRKYTLIVNR